MSGQELNEKDIQALNQQDLSSFNNDLIKKSEIQDWLNRAPLSADAKAILNSIVSKTLDVGKTVIALGQKVMTAIIRVIQAYPNSAIGLIIGTVLTFLIGSIPLIGAILGPFLGPLLVAIGLGKGAIEDLNSHRMETKMASFLADFERLKT